MMRRRLLSIGKQFWGGMWRMPSVSSIPGGSPVPVCYGRNWIRSDGIAKTRSFVLTACLILVPNFFKEEEAFARQGCVLSRSASRSQIAADDTHQLFPEIKQRLSKGLAVTILHEVRIGNTLVKTFGCKVYYDLWEESYNVTPLKGLGIFGASRWLKSAPQVWRACLHSQWSGGRAWQGSPMLTTNLDPISDEQRRNTREWLAERGIGAASGAVLGRAVGAMVNLDQKKIKVRPCQRRNK